MTPVHRILLVFLCLASGPGTVGMAAAAATPQQATEGWLAALRSGQTRIEGNPAIVLSAFCPAEKEEKYAQAMLALASSLASATATVESVVSPRGNFAGCKLVLRENRHPLRVQVLPICLFLTPAGWKVAAGMEHFQNTGAARSAADAALAAAVARETVDHAQQAAIRMQASAADAVRADIQRLRSQWTAEAGPNDMVRRYLAFDQSGDAIGKLACFHLPVDLSAAKLEQFLDLLAGESLASEASEGIESGLPADSRPGLPATTRPAPPVSPRHRSPAA